MDFKSWHGKLKDLAIEKNVVWLIPEFEDYPEEGFEEGYTPEEELQAQLDACDC